MLHPNTQAVYVLHFENHCARVSHYVGRTTLRRLGARMFEHCTGHATMGTANQTGRERPFHLASINFSTDPTAEYLFARLVAETEFCAVCRGAPPLQTYLQRVPLPEALPIDLSRPIAAISVETP